MRHLLAVTVQNEGLPVNLIFLPLNGTPFLNKPFISNVEKLGLRDMAHVS